MMILVKAAWKLCTLARNATNKGWCGGVGDGPWVMADLESGIWACADRPGTNRATLSNDRDFVTAMVKVSRSRRGTLDDPTGDASKGKLVTQFDGPRPTQAPGRAAYYPMRLTGSIILGIGGDNSDGASGAFLRLLGAGASTEKQTQCSSRHQQFLFGTDFAANSGATSTTSSRAISITLPTSTRPATAGRKN